MPNRPSFSQALDMVSNTGSSSPLAHRPVPNRIIKAVDRGVAVEHGRSIVSAARIRAVEHVADEALHATGRLSQSEAFWAQVVPHATGRFQAIADVAAMSMANILAETARND